MSPNTALHSPLPPALVPSTPRDTPDPQPGGGGLGVLLPHGRAPRGTRDAPALPPRGLCPGAAAGALGWGWGGGYDRG